MQLKSFDFEVVTLNAKGKLTNRQSKQAEYFTKDLGGGIILDMVSIPGGTFSMGSPPWEVKRFNWKIQRFNNESPQHLVTVKPFYLGKYPVTQAQWEAVAKLPKVKQDLNTELSDFNGENRPVDLVDWHDAIEFCARLSKKTGKQYRLPSEAEWEYACRAGTTTPFHFGETITPDLVNYDGNFRYASAPKGKYRQQTTDVGSFPPNAFGLYDMHGNVSEWCQDVWHKTYNGAPADGSAWEEGGNSQWRVLRGGSWGDDPRLCRSDHRRRLPPVCRWRICGFRVAASLGLSP